MKIHIQMDPFRLRRAGTSYVSCSLEIHHRVPWKLTGTIVALSIFTRYHRFHQSLQTIIIIIVVVVVVVIIIIII